MVCARMDVYTTNGPKGLECESKRVGGGCSYTVYVLGLCLPVPMLGHRSRDVGSGMGCI